MRSWRLENLEERNYCVPEQGCDILCSDRPHARERGRPVSLLNVSTPEVQFALDAVRRASHLARQVQVELVGASLSKSDRSPVTVADFAVQALVGRRGTALGFRRRTHAAP